MDDYRALAVFVAVVDAGSFTAAGKRLGISTSVVSHHVSRLEERLGVTLFFRSTRALSLSAEAQQILPAARRMVAAGEEAIDALASDGEALSGELRVSLPGFVSGHRFITALWDFALEHPQIQMTVHSSDRQVDLVREGFDLAIRLGRMPDSALKSRRIGTFGRVLVASPDYVKERASINSIEKLSRCAFIRYSMLPDSVTLVRGGEETSIPIGHARVVLDSIATARSAALAGLGVVTLPRSQVDDDIEAGTLVEVLPRWSLPNLAIYAVWPGVGTQKKLTRRMIDWLVAHS